MFQSGLTATWWLQLIYCTAIVIMINRAKGGQKVPEIYKVAGLDALDEAIGRATEMGKPIHYSPGIGGLDNPQTMASFAALGYAAKMCARYDTTLIVSNRISVVYPITEEIVRQAYIQEGKLESLNLDNVRFFSEDQFAYASACVGVMNRERPAANLLIGGFWAESLILAEVGAQIGAIQIAGTANTHQIPFFVAACDYCLIGEEIYAAGAYLSKDPILVGNLIAQDWGKMLCTALIVVGSLISAFQSGPNWLNTLLRK